MPLLTTQLASLTLQSPILNASGAFNPDVFAQLAPLPSQLGALVTKTVTPNAQAGNGQQRTVELAGIGMLNAIGLQSKGLPYTLDVDLPAWASLGVPVILSISAGSSELFAQMVESALAHPAAALIAAFEVNVSCPNVKAGGSLFGADPVWVARAVAAISQAVQGRRPVLVKLTPNVGAILPIAEAALAAGADGLVAINTVLGSHIDVRRRKPSLQRVSGGYSGPGIKPIAIHTVLQLAQAFPNTPIVGVGGIQTATDVLEFLMAGCSAVQVGTAAFANPSVFVGLQTELSAWLEAEGVASVSELIGCAIPQA